MKDKITVSIASIPEREAQLSETISSLIGQVDQINVSLNGYKKIPSIFKFNVNKINYDFTDNKLADAYKFLWADKIKGYHFTCDDDLIYPPDYVKFLIHKIEKYQKRAVVGLHGSILKPKVNHYYMDRARVFHCLNSLADDAGVHILGTGCMAYHSNTINLSIGDFPKPFMADVWAGIAAQKQRVPMVCVNHEAGYLKYQDEVESQKSSTIFNNYFNNISDATQAVRQLKWKIYHVAQNKKTI